MAILRFHCKIRLSEEAESRKADQRLGHESDVIHKFTDDGKKSRVVTHK
jgi:hypothetical protein